MKHVIEHLERRVRREFRERLPLQRVTEASEATTRIYEEVREEDVAHIRSYVAALRVLRQVEAGTHVVAPVLLTTPMYAGTIKIGDD